MCWEVSEPCVIKWIASVGSQGAVFSNWSLKTRSRSGFPSQAKAPQTCLVESIDAHCISVVHRCSLFLLPKPLQTGNLWGRLSILPLTFVSFMKSKSVVSSMIIHHYRKLCKQNWIYIYIYIIVFLCVYTCKIIRSCMQKAGLIWFWNVLFDYLLGSWSRSGGRCYSCRGVAVAHKLQSSPRFCKLC